MFGPSPSVETEMRKQQENKRTPGTDSRFPPPDITYITSVSLLPHALTARLGICYLRCIMIYSGDLPASRLALLRTSITVLPRACFSKRPQRQPPPPPHSGEVFLLPCVSCYGVPTMARGTDERCDSVVLVSPFLCRWWGGGGGVVAPPCWW